MRLLWWSLLLALLMAALLLVPILMLAASPGHAPTPPQPHVHSSAEAAEAKMCHPPVHCEKNVPTPPGCCTGELIKNNGTLPIN